jgi:DNA replication and repair protein RecF
LKLLKLCGDNFRNYSAFEWEPQAGLNVLVGDNAQGKTNLLEAINILATGKSWRTSRDLEIIGPQGDATWLFGLVENTYTTSKLEFRLGRGKQIAVNGKPVRKYSDLLGKLLVVTFTPDNLELVKGSPHSRRKFLDQCLVQISESYSHNLTGYNKALQQRNSLLREGMGRKSLLEPWNEQLVAFGVQLMIYRFKALERLGELTCRYQDYLSEEKEQLSLAYQPAVPMPQKRTAQAWAAVFYQQLERELPQERIRGGTLTGPQRDDLLFLIDGKELKLYGSQGQQRTAALALHLAALAHLEEQMGERPLLLLDDVLSELDRGRRERLFDLIDSGTQTILTTTAADLWEQRNCWQIVAGTISRL